MLLYTPVATAVASEFDITATAIGYQVSLAFLSAMISSLFAGNITVSLGARLTMIVAILLTGTGALTTTLFGLYGIFFGTVLVGFGHGLINPASSSLLANAAKSSRRSLIFSIKQSGTPLGGMLTAIVTPMLAEQYDWRYAGYTLAMVCFVAAICTWKISHNWPEEQVEKYRLSFNPLNSVFMVLRSPSLRILMIVAVCFSSMQLCVMTFLSPYFVEELGYTLVASGTMLATVHFSGGIGRPLFGWFADCLHDNVVLLRILGSVTALCCLATLYLSGQTSMLIISSFCVVIGGASIGWNGLFMAEIINLTPKGTISQATAGMTTFIYTAATVSPFIFALLYQSVGSFSSAIVLSSVVILAGVVGTIFLSRDKP